MKLSGVTCIEVLCIIICQEALMVATYMSACLFFLYVDRVLNASECGCRKKIHKSCV
jgi:hypothetical protein